MEEIKIYDSMKNTSPTVKERKLLRNRALILEAVVKLLSTKNYEEISMADIADVSFFSKQTLYNYFDNKDAIFIALAGLGHQKLTEIFESAINHQIPGLEQVQQLGYAYAKFAEEFPIYRKMLDLVGKILRYFSNPKLVEGKKNLAREIQFFKQQQGRFAKMWISAVQRGIDDKTIRQDLSAPLIAMTLGMISTGMMDELLNNIPWLESRKIKPNEIIDLTFQLLKIGLKND